MPDCSGEPVVTTSCAFLFSHARLRVQRAPGIPCALYFRGWLLAKLGRFHAARMQLAVLNIKSESTAVVPDKRAKASAIRDPYAAASHWAQVSDTFHNHEHRWLWVPAFARTTLM